MWAYVRVHVEVQNIYSNSVQPLVRSLTRLRA